METPKKYKYLFGTAVVLQVSLAILMIASLSTDNWVYSENNLVLFDSDTSDKKDYFKGFKFEGSLSFCNEGCFGSYAGLKTRWCDKYDEVQKMTDDQEYKSVCSMFTNLNSGMLAYALLDILALVGIVLWFIGIACCLRHSSYFKMNYCFSTLPSFFHIVALVTHIGLTNLTFRDECDQNPRNGNSPVLCANHGPKIALVVALILPFLSVFYCIIACRFDRTMKELKIKESREMQPIQLVQILPPALILPQHTVNLPIYSSELRPEEGGH